VLASWLTGQTVNDVEAVRPLVVRDLMLQGFADVLTGQAFASMRQRGRVLFFPLQSGLARAVNCKLASRLQHALPAECRLPKPHVSNQ